MMTRILTLSILLFALNSCKDNETNGILIPYTLYEHQDYSTNKEMRSLIDETLNKDEKALSNLIQFSCGGGAGCYDLGFVMTQIIYKMGEEEFNQMTFDLDESDLILLRGLINVGLEYGDHDKNGFSDNNKIEKEFPLLASTLPKY